MDQPSVITYLTDTQLRRRSIPIDCSRPRLTDQSQKSMTDINIIMETYARTGMLPNNTTFPLQYIDDTNRPTFEQSHDVITIARQRFEALPTALKNELHNDYRKLESWLQNPDNAQRAEKWGLISIHKPENTQPKQETTKVEDSAPST